jgi:site-specific recombinase XerD
VDEEPIPTLIQLIYGEQAALGAEGASEQLLGWRAAFEAWLGSYPEHRRARMIRPWKRLLASCGKMPWQITTQEVRAYLDGMGAYGNANATIHDHRRHLDRFYDWCQAQGIEGLAYNPVKKVPKPKLVKYKNIECLSVVEARRLLAALRRDDTPLGKRDYAFFLARLKLGVQLKTLLGLRWGQIEVEDERAWVSWQEGEPKRAPLPEEVWEAIQSWLESSGRLQHMQPDDYIFVSLADPLHWEGRGGAEAWNRGAPISRHIVNRHLKKFGRLAGIPEEKLRLTVLRHNSVMLRMEAGGELDQIQEFLDGRSKEHTSRYLNFLVALPEGPVGGSSEAGEGGEPSPDGEAGSSESGHEAPHRTRGDKIKHGLYARQGPVEEIAAILAENIEGLEEEIKGLQRLNQELFESFDLAESNQELARLVEVSGRSEERLAELVKTNKELSKRERKGGEDGELRARLEKLANDLGGSLEEWGAPGTGETRQGERAQSIARLRLGRILAMMEGEQRINARLRYTDLYGKTCVKLAKLLRLQAMGEGSLFAWWREAVDEALQDVVEELGISI